MIYTLIFVPLAYYGGYMEHRGHGVPGYYTPGPGGFGNIPLPQMMRGQHYLEPSHIMTNVDYISDQFQG